ncbi:MAG: hypothetical protein AAF098_03385 [Pseudomonadota bacterium]
MNIMAVSAPVKNLEVVVFSQKQTVVFALLAMLFVSRSVFAFEECTPPIKPNLPDGAQATMQEMLKGQNAVKDYQARNMDYMRCLQTHIDKAGSTVSHTLDSATRAIALTNHGRANNAYNAAVSAEEEVAGDFNIELREFKAMNARRN